MAAGTITGESASIRNAFNSYRLLNVLRFKSVRAKTNRKVNQHSQLLHIAAGSIMTEATSLLEWLALYAEDQRGHHETTVAATLQRLLQRAYVSSPEDGHTGGRKK